MRPMILALLLALAPPAVAQQAAPADPEAERILGDFIAVRSGGIWHSESYKERAAAIEAEPERFAPILRERLSRVPATLEEYDPDDPKWVVNDYGDYRQGPQAGALLGAVALLGREHADPILQEFFDRVNPLAIEAERRVWQAEDAYRAGVEGADEMVREAGKVLRAMRGGRAQAVNLALELESPIFVDDITAMLFRNDPAARVGGAEFAGYYIPHFAADRPDAVAKARAGAAALFASDNPRVARAGRRLLERLDKELGPEKAPDGPLPPAPVEKDAPD